MIKKSADTTRIAVLAGGSSSEREVSLQSGANVQKALKKAGYKTVDLIDPTADGFVTTMASGVYDAAFVALHGAGGEDGTIQALLEALHVPYTGSDATASMCGADKNIAKLLYAQAGIPTARGLALKNGEDYSIDKITEVVGKKSFVKPAVNGSSYGVSLVKDPSQLVQAIQKAFVYDDKILIEECLEGIEITVGVFDDGCARALPIVEICKPEDSEFYDLHVKYISPEHIHRIPAQISAEDYARAQELAVEAHKVLGCSGFSRSDFIVTDRGPVILETNTIPGMTDASLYPDELRHANIEFSDVCSALIDIALKRAGDSC